MLQRLTIHRNSVGATLLTRCRQLTILWTVGTIVVNAVQRLVPGWKLAACKFHDERDISWKRVQPFIANCNPSATITVIGGILGIVASVLRHAVTMPKWMDLSSCVQSVFSVAFAQFLFSHAAAVSAFPLPEILAVDLADAAAVTTAKPIGFAFINDRLLTSHHP